MNDRKMLRVGLGGAAVSLLCCFTPILVILVAGVGLSVVIGWLDHILFPLFFTFMGVAAYALYLRAGRTAAIFATRWPGSTSRSPSSATRPKRTCRKDSAGP